jgi:hypothetical protein
LNLFLENEYQKKSPNKMPEESLWQPSLTCCHLTLGRVYSRDPLSHHLSMYCGTNSSFAASIFD